jgi:membrane protein
VSAGFKRSLVEHRSRPTLMRGWRARVYRLFSEDLWRAESKPLAPLNRIVRRIGRLGFLTLSGFTGDRCMVRAAALTYTTVLSLVPLLALSFSVLKGLGYYDKFRRGTVANWLEKFAPTGEGPTTDYAHGLRTAFEKVLDMVDATDATGLQVAGLLVVMWAVVRMMETIEAAFNEIWGARRMRSFVRRVTDYLAIVIVTPILLVVGTGLAAKARETSIAHGLGPGLEALMRLSPLVLSWMAFSFVYLCMPNTRTSLRSSLVGGFWAAVAWQVTLALHVRFQMGVARYNAVYSTFAAIPIFLVWLQLSWAIVLFGAELAYAHQHESEFRRVVGWTKITPTARAALALRVAARLTQAFLSDSPPRTASDLARDTGVPSAPVDEVLDYLDKRGIAACSEDEGQSVWILARDPGRVRVADVLGAAEIEGADAVERLPATSALDLALERSIAALDAERKDSASNLSLREIVERVALEAQRSSEPVLGAAELGASQSPA